MFRLSTHIIALYHLLARFSGSSTGSQQNQTLFTKHQENKKIKERRYASKYVSTDIISFEMTTV